MVSGEYRIASYQHARAETASTPGACARGCVLTPRVPHRRDACVWKPGGRYALGYWITQPVLPFLSKKLGADAIVFGQLQTLFSLVQLVGNPVIGRLCDVHGAKIALQMCQVRACVCVCARAPCARLLWR